MAARAAIVDSALMPQATVPSRVPVIVELFTSEGCSSCPAADDLLTKLVTTQPVTGVEIIALGEHVDYWDSLGWRDPFSSAAFSRRQSEYASKAFHSDTRYTPQMIVDGQDQFVGSDARAAATAIAKSAQRAKIPLRLSIAVERSSQSSAGGFLVTLAADGMRLAATADAFLALTENGLSTEVRAGENGGRQLRHTSVVRTFIETGSIPAGATHWSDSRTIHVSADWNRTALQVVAFGQDRSTRRIVAVSNISKLLP
jgi:hypothetical protein